MYSLHGVRPAAPLAWIQCFEVEPELDQAEIVDHPLVEASVAARHQLKYVSCGLKSKRVKIYNSRSGCNKLTWTFNAS